MGLYDTVRIQCPICKHTSEFQTKVRDGESNLDYFRLNDAPLILIADLINRKLDCQCCQRIFIIDVDFRTRLHALTPEEYRILGIPDSYKTCKNCCHRVNAECAIRDEEIFDFLGTCADWRDRRPEGENND